MTTDKCTKDISTKLKGKLKIGKKVLLTIISKKEIQKDISYFSLIKLSTDTI